MATSSFTGGEFPLSKNQNKQKPVRGSTFEFLELNMLVADNFGWLLLEIPRKDNLKCLDGEEEVGRKWLNLI